MSIPRFSPIDDDVQAWNEDEYEAGITRRGRRGSAFLHFSNSGVGVLAGLIARYGLFFMLEAASSELGIRGTARLPNPFGQKRSLAR
jgi:hypothetical protein